MRRRFVLVGLAVVCLIVGYFICRSVPRTDDERLVFVIDRAVSMMGRNRPAEAVGLLRPLAPTAGDRRVIDARGYSTSVVEELGQAYFQNRDTEAALPLLERAALAWRPRDCGEPSLVLIVKVCRERLIAQGHRDIGWALDVNRTGFAPVADAQGGPFVELHHVAHLIDGRLLPGPREGSWRLRRGRRDVMLVMGPSSGCVRVRVVGGRSMAPVRALIEALGGRIRGSDPRSRMISADVP